MNKIRKFLSDMWPPVLVITLLLGFFGGLFCLLQSEEIRPCKYEQIRDWTKDFPQLRPLVRDAKWDDDYISRWEFNELRIAADKMRSEKYIQEAIGE